MKPGIYHNLTFDEYKAIAALNQSVLKLMDPDEPYGATPLHARAVYRSELERDDTATLRLGRAEHCWIVEGRDEFYRRFMVAPACCEAKKKSGEQCQNAPSYEADGHWFCGVHRPKESHQHADFVTADDVQRIQRMAESVHNHEIGRHCRRPGWSEATIVYEVSFDFTHQHCFVCGLPKLSFAARCEKCGKSTGGRRHQHTQTYLHKVRLDRLAEPMGKFPHLVLDLKRMQVMDGRRSSREQKIEVYGWDVQAAMYVEAVKSAYDVKRVDFAWVFVEEKPPHDVTWFPADKKTLAIGADKLQRYRKAWAVCDLTGNWPGFAVGDQKPGGLSDWYKERYFERKAER